MVDVEIKLLESVLRKHENDNSITITKVCNEPACEKGENFMSVVTRLNIEGQKNVNNALVDYTTSLVIKQPYKHEGIQEKFNSNKTFMNEVTAYNEIIPALKKYTKVPLSIAECLYADQNLIILEDLTAAGYEMRKKEPQLSIKQCLEVIKEIAAIHSAALILSINQKKKVKQLAEKIFEIYYPKNESIVGFVTANIDIAITLLKSVEQTEKVINVLHIIEKYREKIYYKVCDLFETEFNVSIFNHGDCWRNNLLFKTAPEGIKVKLIDLQLMRSTSPAADLTYFLYINLSPEERNRNMDLFLDTYLESVRQIIEQHNLDMNNHYYTKEMLEKELADFSVFGFMCGLWISPAIFNDKKVFPDMQDITPEFLDADYHKEFILKHMTPKLKARLISLCLDFVQNYSFLED